MGSDAAASAISSCSRRERLADAGVHAAGVAMAPLAAAWLLVTAAEQASGRAIASLAVYASGLVGMLWASAAYNLAPPGPTKEALRRLDHAMIFFMIAGSYTPYAVNLDGFDGAAIGGIVWIGAVMGATLKLAMPRRLETLGLVLYLGLGWAILAELGALRAAMSPQAFTLLVGGGIIYTFGAIIHHWDRLPYHTALWHGLVLIAAGCHFASIFLEFALPS